MEDIVADKSLFNARLEVFKCHWQQIRVLAEQSVDFVSSSTAPLRACWKSESVEVATHYIEQMLALLLSDLCENNINSSILKYCVENHMLRQMHVFCLLPPALDQFKISLLRFYCEVLSGYEDCLSINSTDVHFLTDDAIFVPLYALLNCVSRLPSYTVEFKMVELLHQLCIALKRHPRLLLPVFLVYPTEVTLNSLMVYAPSSSAAAAASKRHLECPVVSLLLPYVHRDGTLGQLARDSILLVMGLADSYEQLGDFIAEQSEFAPVLVMGLSGLYSALPKRLTFLDNVDNASTDWSCLTRRDVDECPPLLLFITALQFTNAIVQVADETIISDQLAHLLVTAFLEPVLGPALALSCGNELVTATAYLELFLRQITERKLVDSFVKFIINFSCDNIELKTSVPLISLLAPRLGVEGVLCHVTLQLFRTLFSQHSQTGVDNLVLGHLLPCNHLLVSQRDYVQNLDHLAVETAQKFVQLSPIYALKVFDYEVEALRLCVSESIRQAEQLPKRAGSMRTAKPVTRKPAAAAATRARPPSVTSDDLPSPDDDPSGGLIGMTFAEAEFLASLQWASKLVARASADCRIWDMSDSFGQLPAIAVRPGCASQLLERFVVLDDTQAAQADSGDDAAANANGTLGADGSLDEFMAQLDRMDGGSEAASSCDVEELLSSLDDLHARLVPDTSAQDALAGRGGARERAESNSSRVVVLPHIDLNRALSISGSEQSAAIGPLLHALLERLSNAVSNRLVTNLLLTGCLAELAAYPHLVVRSFLLCPEKLVFQPSVKSLAVALHSVRQQLVGQLGDAQREPLRRALAAARAYLMRREPAFVSSPLGGVGRAAAGAPVDNAVLEPYEVRPPAGSAKPNRKSLPSPQSPAKTRLNLANLFKSRRRTDAPALPLADRLSLTTMSQSDRNAVFCAVVMHEFCLELAALCLQHSVANGGA